MLRFGTIGTGWITDEYIRGAKDSGLWKLAAVYSRDLARAQAYAGQHGATYAYDTVEALAQSDKIDAVYVASPNALHYAHCKALLEAGKHVICEKPLCAQAAKVEELNRLAASRGLVFLEAIMFLHQPQLRSLELALGQIGTITLAKLDFCQRSSKLDRYLAGELPNIFNPQLETGALMDLGIYCVYPALYLFGKPESAQICSHLLKSGADGCGVDLLQLSDLSVDELLAPLAEGRTAAFFNHLGEAPQVEQEQILFHLARTIQENPDRTEYADCVNTLRGNGEYDLTDAGRAVWEHLQSAVGP